MDPLDFDVLNDQPVPTYQAAPPANPPTFQTPTGQQVRRPSFNSTQPGLQEQYANDDIPHQAEGPSTCTREDIQYSQSVQSSQQNIQYGDQSEVQEVESQPGPSTSNMIQEDEVVEQRNVSIDEPEADSSDRLDNTVLIKSAVIGKDDKDKRKRRRELMDYDDRQRTIKLINNFSEEQINRYEMYRRSCFQKNQIKRLMTMTTPCTVHQHVSIAVAGIAKVFVGELVEEALKVADAQNHKGGLLPSHIRESVRRLGHVSGSHLHEKKRKKTKLF
ncbi:unnamed protein product [Oikopleura dioica]|uniref:Transcription initiation factor TFIID subunit 11 n=1 Tax=Oikopleura dioica TaxID=34765 RepID=E4XD21_OIKDI|nr:unnamed protein product [Oikopleura dioica]